MSDSKKNFTSPDGTNGTAAPRPDRIDELKTGAFDRRMSLAKAGLKAGARWASSSAGSLFVGAEQKEQRKKQMMSEQAQYLVTEMGKLKGSIVKIGQMMALYGEHFLPPEVTEALHSLNNNTTALSWTAIEQQLRRQLGVRLDELTVDPEPLGAASLAQVHRAVRKSDGLELVLKVQYPGVAEAIDSDLSLFRNLIRLSRAVPQTREFEEWFGEVRDMMHREVDYAQEMATTQRFAERLKDDPRFVVPRIIEELCGPRVIAMTYERGIPVNSPILQTLPQARRNALGEASLSFLLHEIFQWGEMQTDPNFGNYLIRLGNGKEVPDRIVLLDFGAIRPFDSNLLQVAQNLIRAGSQHELNAMIVAMRGYDFFDQMPAEIKPSMAQVFLQATEPFSQRGNNPDAPAESFDDQGKYVWKAANLHQRVMQQMGSSMASRYFSVPPKEFMFISRKFIGAYTFMTVLDARTDTAKLLQQAGA